MANAHISLALIIGTDGNQCVLIIRIHLFPLASRRIVISHTVLPHHPQMITRLGKMHEVTLWYCTLPEMQCIQHSIRLHIKMNHQAIPIHQPSLIPYSTNIFQPLSPYRHTYTFPFMGIQEFFRCCYHPIVFGIIHIDITNRLLDAHRQKQLLKISPIRFSL